jgi:hypothetical protein
MLRDIVDESSANEKFQAAVQEEFEYRFSYFCLMSVKLKDQVNISKPSGHCMSIRFNI